MLLLVSQALALQPARSAAIVTSNPRYGVSRHGAARASGAMDWLRRNEPARRGRESDGEDDSSERGEARVFDAANDVDTIDFGGAVGGGTLTRESIASAGRTISPAIAAEQALQAACDDCGSLEPDKAAELLQRVIGDAYSAGVAATNPQMRTAAALLSAIEAASDTVASVGLAPEGEIGTDTFGSLFADEYAIDD